ncbi:MAG: glucosaminidase domain-containing protein [Chitinophagaceae bacterium]|nr:glucosaminidase domain-containing protein [Chitinophagaceae bacterium]
MQRIIVLSGLLMLAVLTASSQRKEDIVNYINAYKDIAISEMKRTGVPASIKLAQGIHETSAGTSDLVQKSNNHFGIKCKTGWAGPKVYHDDDAAGECFRSYEKAEDSYRDHSDFLKRGGRYAFLFQLDPTDYEGWAYGLKKAGYATNIKYSQILIRLIKENNLEQYTLMGLSTLNPGELATTDGSKDQEEASNESTYSGPAITMPAPDYPSVDFLINKTKVIFVKPGTSWLSIAQTYDLQLKRLLDFNDLESEVEIGKPGQLVFLQRKRKEGAKEFHIVQARERLYDICQEEGIRMESLLSYNQLDQGMQPAVGEKLYLQTAADKRPELAATPDRRSN